MTNNLYFHDGYIISFSVNRCNCKISNLKLVFDLYRNSGDNSRMRYILLIKNLKNLKFSGDFIVIHNNLFAGTIEDGFIDKKSNFIKVSLKLTGGYLEAFGEDYKLTGPS